MANRPIMYRFSSSRPGILTSVILLAVVVVRKRRLKIWALAVHIMGVQCIIIV